jgi:hypothetical protein
LIQQALDRVAAADGGISADLVNLAQQVVFLRIDI